MSQANAAAIKRRANPGTQSLSTQNNIAKQIPGTPSPPNVNNPGLTLPQVITLVDKRLTHLETFMNQSKENPLTDNDVETSVFENILESMTNEINSRFEILAGEISNLKEIVLKLQTYTMDVNKVLFTERFTGIVETKESASHIEEETVSQSKDTSTSIDFLELVKEEFDTPTENNIVFTNS